MAGSWDSYNVLECHPSSIFIHCFPNPHLRNHKCAVTATVKPLQSDTLPHGPAASREAIDRQSKKDKMKETTMDVRAFQGRLKRKWLVTILAHQSKSAFFASTTIISSIYNTFEVFILSGGFIRGLPEAQPQSLREPARQSPKHTTDLSISRFVHPNPASRSFLY
jgi:hypothetical protein